MKTSIISLSILGVSLLPIATASAQLIDPGMPEHLFTLGLRAGLNTSNLNINKDIFNGWNVNSWGTGFELGVVANINLRNFLTLQPGFFYESRSGNYAYDSEFITYWGAGAGEMPVFENITQLGHYRNYHFTVPVMVQFRLALAPGVTWSVEAGPYFSWLLHSKHGDTILYQEESYPGVVGALLEAEPNRYDFGFQFGTGIHCLRYLYLGVHYKAGARNVWNREALGGRHKIWSVTAGIDF